MGSPAANQCYYPNGRSASTDFPCDPGVDDSPCCGGGLGSTCLTNKLCSGPDGNIVRGSCTSQAWSSSACPLYCLSANTGGTDLISCSNVTRSDTSYCCDHNAFCCDSGVGRFDVVPSKPQTWATWSAAASQFVVVNPLSTAAASSSPSSTLASKTSNAPFLTTTPPGNDTTSGTPQPSQPAQGLTAGAQAGIGVGAAVGALLIAAVVFLLWKMKKNKKLLEGKQRTENTWPAVYPEPPKMELVGATPLRQELDGSYVPTELPAVTDRAELYGHRV
ncbi:hypothetical protein B0T25DRAFT_584295 [Lasiosphaeria hispida]|uniref:Mid2 domain-containing protein n=1 Tax=Lasiosphaeria hispida TaxID=260671 RepID=A0AAJ0HCW4_9PEZI|nr:hypothetical protein B0T25DRAFT_584295 [Lasiosphaeria hispida]